MALGFFVKPDGRFPFYNLNKQDFVNIRPCELCVGQYEQSYKHKRNIMKMKLIQGAMTALLIVANSLTFAQDKHEHHGKKEAAVVTTKADTISTLHMMDMKPAAGINKIVEKYLQLKNALVNDNTEDAGAAGKEIVGEMGKFDKLSLTAEQKKLYEDVEDDAREHAEHIGENAGNIEHQREHFEMLSKDLYDLVKVFGSDQVLYKDFCPMYNDKKGAIWLSEIKTIKNPYYGKKMQTCGSMKEEIK